MLKITADVNGHVIGYIFVHRKHTGDEVNSYDAAIVDGSGYMLLGLEDIKHPYSEGWTALLKEVLNESEGSFLHPNKQEGGS